MSERSVPHSLEAEQSLLGALLVRDDAWTEVAAVIAPETWYREGHRRIWLAMHRLKRRGATLDPVTLMNELVTAGDLVEAGGAVYIGSLLDGQSRSANAMAYAGIVREKARLRQLQGLADRLSEAASTTTDPCSQLADAAIGQLLALQGDDGRPAVRIGTAAMHFLDALDTEVAVIPTGFTDLDHMLTGGLRRKELVLVAGRPGGGKTSLGLGVGRHAASKGHPVVVFSLEMSREALTGRLVSWEARVRGQDLARRKLDASAYQRLSQALQSLQEVPLSIDDTSRTLAQMSATCQRLKAAEGLAVVVVDYLQLIAGTREANREQQVAAIGRGLARLAKDEDVAVVALAQLSRAPEGRKDKRPILADLRESGALEQDADTAVLLFREEMHQPTEENRGIAEAIVAKQRNGPTGVTKLYFAAEYSWFTDLAPSN